MPNKLTLMIEFTVIGKVDIVGMSAIAEDITEECVCVCEQIIKMRPKLNGCYISRTLSNTEPCKPIGKDNTNV